MRVRRGKQGSRSEERARHSQGMREWNSERAKEGERGRENVWERSFEQS